MSSSAAYSGRAAPRRAGQLQGVSGRAARAPGRPPHLILRSSSAPPGSARGRAPADDLPTRRARVKACPAPGCAPGTGNGGAELAPARGRRRGADFADSTIKVGGLYGICLASYSSREPSIGFGRRQVLIQDSRAIVRPHAAGHWRCWHLRESAGSRRRSCQCFLSPEARAGSHAEGSRAENDAIVCCGSPSGTADTSIKP